jgi:hypothetical protein
MDDQHETEPSPLTNKGKRKTTTTTTPTQNSTTQSSSSSRRRVRKRKRQRQQQHEQSSHNNDHHAHNSTSNDDVKWQANKAIARLTSFLEDHDNTTSLIRITDIDMIQQIEGMIKLQWHYDQEQHGGKQSIQCILAWQSDPIATTTSSQMNIDHLTTSSVTETKDDPTSMSAKQNSGCGKFAMESLARATVFIGGSSDHNALFVTYYQIFIVDTQEPSSSSSTVDHKGTSDDTSSSSDGRYAWSPDTCPTWFYRFSLVTFNHHLTLLHQMVHPNNDSISETKHKNDVIDDTTHELLTKWLAALRHRLARDDVIIPSEPFPLLLTNYADGDACLFIPRTIHAILDSKRAALVRLKCYLGLHSISPNLPRDPLTGMVVSEGRYKTEAREFELKHATPDTWATIKVSKQS